MNIEYFLSRCGDGYIRYFRRFHRCGRLIEPFDCFAKGFQSFDVIR